MENYSTNTLNPGPIYHKKYLSPCVDPSFKVDEGYSEETRSQDDVDSPMRLDSGSDEMKTIPVPMVASLPEGIMALNEAERSGMLPTSVFGSRWLNVVRFRVQCIANIKNVIDRCNCGAFEAFTSHRSCCRLTSRDNLGNIFLSYSVHVTRSVESVESLARIDSGWPPVETEI